ncbi:hypothetical protein JAAARDRAFT_64869 [Jaapia argillacea MUCL 33604]|uniref:Hydrophobin n=1 Tax=Jaapia argillacea MUCL 33604 TaxID=933084 RepID=A0A067QDR3_9AGAM|nr:hypothetical protein JAAARDRAFT_64869 [Jaapia argillacea MUCL 33604]
MRFSIVSAFIAALCASSALAGYNCKCQDSRGQYNELTRYCCEQQPSWITGVFFPGPNNQCVSALNHIDSGAFVQCCQGQGVGGAFCWD